VLAKLKLYFRNIKPDQILYLLLACEFINVAYFFIFFSEHHYLPGPFIWDKNDTFMDFYSPLYWALNDGFYSSYKSIYPPLNYYFLKLFTIGLNRNEIFGPFELRQNFPNLILVVSVLYLGMLFAIVNIGEWRKIRVSNRFLIWLACAISVPTLFALERGNLIFLAVLFLALYASTENQWLKAIYLGILINIKPYFLLLLIPYLNCYQFNRGVLIKSFLACSLIFWITSFAPGFSVATFIASYFNFAAGSTMGHDGMLALPNTLMNLYAVKWVIVYGGAYPETQHTYAFWFSFIKVMGYLTLLILLLVLLFRRLNGAELFIGTIIFITNFSITMGGYIYLCYLVLLPYLLFSREYKKLSMLVLVIFCFPLDWIEALNLFYEARSSYLGGGFVLGQINLAVSLGAIVRPICNYLLMALFIGLLVKKYGFYGPKNAISQ